MSSNLDKTQMKPQLWHGPAAGAIVALVVSAAHSMGFRADYWGPLGCITWYLVSTLIGAAAGFVGGVLAGFIPSRSSRAADYAAGALMGLIGYYLQVRIFLIYVFSNTTWE
jgi:hypothetical protein